VGFVNQEKVKFNNPSMQKYSLARSRILNKNRVLMFFFLALLLVGVDALAQGTIEKQITVEKEAPKLDCNCKSIRSRRNCRSS